MAPLTSSDLAKAHDIALEKNMARLAKAHDIAREKTMARLSNLLKDKELDKELELREKIEAEQHREREKIRADRRKKRSEERSVKDAALKSGPAQQYWRSEISGDGGFSDLAKAHDIALEKNMARMAKAHDIAREKTMARLAKAHDIAREKTMVRLSNLLKDKELELREKIEDTREMRSGPGPMEM